MAKLVGVYHDDTDAGRGKPTCLARRQLPLVIESDLTMIMALDDACLACSSTTLTDNIENKKSRSSINNQLTRDREAFLKKYAAMSSDELSAALMVTFEDLSATLSAEVACVGCRRSVETLLQNLFKSGDSALEPLVITEDGVISVSRDHVLAPQALANLFCVQLQRLESTYMESSSNSKKQKKNLRCPAHSLGLVMKRSVTVAHWLDTWECMEKECQEEVVLIHFDLLRSTLDRYLKKHSFCSECSNMVNRAYNLLIRSDAERSNSPEVLTSTCQAGSAASDQDDDCKSDNLYKGITPCTADQHVHVDSSTDFISKLINLAEPELSGLRQERHAKTIEIAKKEVLTCIGICLYERFQRIQQRLREGQQACDILFLTALKSLKKSYEMAFESKQGISDLEKLCQEFDEEEKRKLLKAQKKRDKKSKQQQLKKKKDIGNGNAASPEQEVVAAEEPKCDVTLTPMTNGNIIEEKKKTQLIVLEISKSETNSRRPRSTSSSSRSSSSGCSGDSVNTKTDDEVPSKSTNESTPSAVEEIPETRASRLSCVTSVCKKVTQVPTTSGDFSILSLESLLDGADDGGEEDADGLEDGIPLEDIRNFQERQSVVSQQREELRRNLRQRFAQLCVNGL